MINTLRNEGFFMPDIELARRTQQYVDISLSFDPNPLTNDITTLKNERAINNSIKNLIMIVPTEVPFRSEVGSIARDSLFELMDGTVKTQLEQEVIRTINYNEPRVELSHVSVSGIEGSNEVRVLVEYNIVGQPQTFTVTHILTPTD